MFFLKKRRRSSGITRCHHLLGLDNLLRSCLSLHLRDLVRFALFHFSTSPLHLLAGGRHWHSLLLLPCRLATLARAACMFHASFFFLLFSSFFSFCPLSSLVLSTIIAVSLRSLSLSPFFLFFFFLYYLGLSFIVCRLDALPEPAFLVTSIFNVVTMACHKIQ